MWHAGTVAHMLGVELFFVCALIEFGVSRRGIWIGACWVYTRVERFV